MKSRVLILVSVVVVAALIALPGSVFANTSGAGGPALGTEVSITPAAGRDGAYVCTARILDAATGAVLSEPSIIFRSGEKAEFRSGVQVQGKASEIIVTVSADASRRAATVRVELAAGASRSTVQVMSVQL